MNEEIKEILHKLNNKAEHYILYDYEVKLLLDYITNLQQIEQDHKKINGELRERIAYLERSNDRREDTILGLRQEIYEQEDYKSRCEKAIDKLTIKQARFINEKGYVLDDNDLDEIMYILQNGSEEK